MERPSSTEVMLSSMGILPVAEIPKERCPMDNSTIFYYLEAGISYRCRHCKQTHVALWEEVLQKYQEVRQKVGLD